MTKLIAEIGWNHLGNMTTAKDMVRAAALNGADVIKFQAWQVKNLKPGPWDNDGRRQLYEKAELKVSHMHILKEKCESFDKRFGCSVFSIEDAERYKPFSEFKGVSWVKIPSPEVMNFSLLLYCFENFNEVVLSIGATTREEKIELVNFLNEIFLRPRKCDKLTVMHCVSAYPCELNQIFLQGISDIESLFWRLFINNNLEFHTGFSDHTEGIIASVFALPLNIEYIEKHFTTDNTFEGRDNQFSILPQQLAELKTYRDAVEKVYILDENVISDKEQEIRNLYRGRWHGKSN